MNMVKQSNSLIIEQASYWAVLLDDGELSEKDRRELTHWLLMGPAHVEEFIHACVLLDLMSDVDQGKKLSVDKLLAQVESAAGSKVTPITQHQKLTGNNSDHETSGRPRKTRWLPVAACLLAGAIFAYQMLPVKSAGETPVAQNQPVQYKTSLGEQRSITLEDGSIIYLNTLTAVDINYTGKYRNIVLHQGEAIFKVAHNLQKPFRVWVNDTMFQALGTEFNVRSEPGSVALTVLTGEVALAREAKKEQLIPFRSTGIKLTDFTAPDLTKDRPLLVTVGQKAVLQDNGNIHTEASVDVARETSWKSREMIFRNDRLDNVVREFNRYNALQVTIASADLSGMSVTGVFETNDPMSLLNFLESSGKARIEKTDINKVTVYDR